MPVVPEPDPNEGISRIVLLRRGALLSAVATGQGHRLPEQTVLALTAAHYAGQDDLRKRDLEYLVERGLIVLDPVIVSAVEIPAWRLTANGQDVMDGKPWRGVQVAR